MDKEQFREIWCRVLDTHLGNGRTDLKKEDLELLASFG